VELTRIGIRGDGKLEITLFDRLLKVQAKARARTIVNAAGPWVDRILSILMPRHQPLLRLSKGIHLVVKQRFSEDAVLFSSSDRRVIFAIPWGPGSLIGTTDTEYKDLPEFAAAEERDIEFLITELGRFSPDLTLQRKDIITTFAGVRPLARTGSRNTAKASRDHVVTESPTRFFSLSGGKYTTHRLLAKEVLDRVEISLGRKPTPCRTAEIPLTGSFDLGSDETSFGMRPDLCGIGRAALEHLIRTYGRRMKYVLAIANRNTALAEPLCEHHDTVQAQVIYALEYELARTLTDVCIRRLRLDQKSCRGMDCAGKAADLLAERLRWTVAQKENEIYQYENWVHRNTQFLT
jgi:glycerol-3-phosphate dehydrogenase